VGKEGIVLTGVSATGYTIESVASNGHVFEIINNAGTLTYPCSPEESGGCPKSKVWNE
jgi:hypothetical protein